MSLQSQPQPARLAILATRAEQQHGLLTMADFSEAGMSSQSISRWASSGRLIREARGVYRVGGCPPSAEASILATVLVHGAGTWASHRTAAWLWRLEGFGRPGRTELTRFIASSNQRSAAIVHRTRVIPAHHQARVGPIPVTSLPRTLFDLAGSLGRLPLGRAIEAGLRTRSCTIASLYRVTEELGRRGRAGTAAMRSALAERGPGFVPTESELDLLGRAVVASISGIDWQVSVSDERGYIRRVDGLHRAARLVIEWDGAEFHDGVAQRRLDAANDRRLAALGLRVVRYRWDDVTLRPESVRSEVGNLVANHTPSSRIAA